MAVGPPFAVMCLGYAITGFALAIQNAQGNTFVTQLPGKVSNNMAILHSAYGVGALVAPLVATQFTLLPRWSYFFFVSLGIAFISLVLSVSVFRFQRAEGLLANISPRPSIATQQTTETEAFEDNAEQKNKYHQVFKQKSTHLLALFLMVYVGVEVTLGGWIVTFLIELRGGGVSAGYVSSGFFAGLTLGRLVLLPVTKFIGISRVVYVYSVLAMGFELIVWFVPNLITNAVAVAIVGLVLAPLYPITMNVASQVLPPWVLAGSIGWIAAVGQAGSAIFPFITGVLATRYGVQILQPLVMVMLFITMIIWTMFALVNNTRLKAD
ncbi:hypothetical protein FRC02_004987 [Tulasnella sp. 418]|nr:hypothetical protein FRC02_004987 [Tulasnella sp. 418]